MPIQQKKVLFLSHLGKGYGCNPRYLCEYLAEHHKEFRLLWVYDRAYGMPKELPNGVKALPYYSRRYEYEIATCGVLVANTRVPECFMFDKRPGQRYLQTWHSSLRLKCIEADAGLPEDYVKGAKEDSKKIDLIISGCGFSTDIYRNSFWYDGPIEPTGTPRVDYLLSFDQSQRPEILEQLGIASDNQVALYAPTFRKGNSLEAYDIDYQRLKAALEGKTGGRWSILVRLHPNISDKVSFGNLCEGVIDASRYPDMQELLAVSDLLITDYSSSMFDMAFLRRPCILYVSDLEHYLATERCLYFEINALPFPLAQNNNDLEKVILDFDLADYSIKVDSFLKQIGSHEDGHACERIVQRFFHEG